MKILSGIGPKNFKNGVYGQPLVTDLILRNDGIFPGFLWVTVRQDYQIKATLRRMSEILRT